MLAMLPLLAKLPATRQTKRSPSPLSKAYSRAMRESSQAKDRRVGILAARQRFALMLEVVALCDALHIAAISLLQPFQCR